MGKLSLENVKTLIDKGYITDTCVVGAFKSGDVDTLEKLVDNIFITQVNTIENLSDIAGVVPDAPSIDSVDPTSLSFKYTGETKTINVTTTGEGELSCSGLSKFKASVADKVITVVAPANATSAEISETLTIAIAGGNSKTVTCTQEGKPNIDSVDPKSLSFKYTGEDETVTVTTSGADAVITASDISPLTTSIEGKTVTVTAPNNTSAAITKTLTLSIAGGNSIDVICTQEGVPTISKVDPTSLNFEAAGGSKTVTVTTTGADSTIKATKTTHFSASVSDKIVTISAEANSGAAIPVEKINISIDGGNNIDIDCTQDAGASRAKK